MSTRSFRILIVCTGNTCRSPMAEGMLNKKLGQSADVWISSAGTSGLGGAAASEGAVAAAQSLGVDISNHRSSPLSTELLEKANLILVMAESHRQLILQACSDAADKVFLLCEFGEQGARDVPDPIGAPVSVYRQCAETISECLDGVVAQLPELRKKFTQSRVDFAVGVDHRGFVLKERFLNILNRMNQTWEDFGTYSGDSVDYPQFAFAVGEAVASGAASRGALVCGTGLGMALAANKVIGIRAAVVTNELLAEKSRSHNNCNVIVLCEDLSDEQMAHLLDVWIRTEFEGGRHGRRVDQIMEYERTKRS